MSNVTIPSHTPKSSKDLRDLAFRAKHNKVSVTAENSPIEDLDPSEIQEIVIQLAEMIVSSAREGKLDFTYNVEHYSENTVEAITRELRLLYSHLLIVRDFGRKQVSVSWAENI